MNGKRLKEALIRLSNVISDHDANEMVGYENTCEPELKELLEWLEGVQRAGDLLVHLSRREADALWALVYNLDSNFPPSEWPDDVLDTPTNVKKERAALTSAQEKLYRASKVEG